MDDEGLAVGWATLVALNPVEGLQEYVLPTMDAVPIRPEVVVQFRFNVVPALAVGEVVFTVTVTVDVAVHPLLPVTVTVYVVVTLGEAVGCAILVALKPVDGLQEYVLPTTLVEPILPDVVLQFKLKADPALAVGAVLFELTVTVEVAVQLLLLVTVTV